MPGVYVSFPFCAQKCTFCNFASGVFPRGLEQDYLAALLYEIRHQEWHWRPKTVYLGGGTPSRIEPEALTQLLDAIPGRPWREATIEAAPGSLTAENVRVWRDAGINRVSLGVQSFVGRELAQTGRRHTAETVFRDCDLLRNEGINNFNIDLICGLPFQTRESWRESLDSSARLQPPHVSVYLFEVDEDSRLGLEVLNGGAKYGASSVPDEDRVTELYEYAVERLQADGIERYEISNFAAAGFESIHNLKYWLLEPYIGFGADAHSFDAGTRWSNVESAAEYVARRREGRCVRQESSPSNEQEERFFVGLRLMRGVRTQPADRERYGASIERLVDAGLLAQHGDTLQLTRRGVLLSNEVFQEFIS